MEVFLSGKREKDVMILQEAEKPSKAADGFPGDGEDSTEIKLAILSSLFPDVEQTSLLDLLISADGSVDAVSASLSPADPKSPTHKRPGVGIGHQTSLSSFRKSESEDGGNSSTKRRALTRKGQTLHLYSPADITHNSPCSVIHNFLPVQEAEDLLKELLEEAPTFERQTFKLFDNVVESPHSACFYVQSLEEEKRQKTEYLYNGSYLTVRFDLFEALLRRM